MCVLSGIIQTYPKAFPPGEHFTVPTFPNLTVVNELGDFGIAADRLAIIDGEGESLDLRSSLKPLNLSSVDPWRPCTPHSDYAADREDTILRPFKLIPGMSYISFCTCILIVVRLDAVHHYDEYGLRDINDEPPEIQQIHTEMIQFVLEWLKDWKSKDGSI